jgi:hypothetical protein
MAATGGILSEFDYFKPVVSQSMIIEEYDHAIGVTSPVTAIDQAIMFDIPAEDNVYRDLNSSYLVLKVKVTKADNGALTAGTDAVAPTNLLFSSMFKNVEVHLNGTQVSHANTLHAYRAYIETVCTYSEAVLNSRGILEGWCKDDPAVMNGIAFSSSGVNSGFVTRNKWISGADTVLTLVGRPHADLFHQDLDIPAGVRISLKFIPHEPKFMLQCASNATFKIVPVSQRLFVHSKKLSPEAIAAHKEMCERTGGFRIPITRVCMNMHDVSGSGSEIGSLVPGDNLPSRIVLGLAKTAAMNGAFELNPFDFKPLGLTDISIKAGGLTYPREGLKMDFAKGDYELAYLSTLSALGVATGNRALAISPHDWATSYNLHAFKLLPGPLEYASGSEPRKGKCTANLTFSSANTELHLIVYAEVPQAILISAGGEVTVVGKEDE